MFYIKSNIGNGAIIEVDLTIDNINWRCDSCRKDMLVNRDEIQENGIFNLFHTALCAECEVQYGRFVDNEEIPNSLSDLEWLVSQLLVSRHRAELEAVYEKFGIGALAEIEPNRIVSMGTILLGMLLNEQ